MSYLQYGNVAYTDAFVGIWNRIWLGKEICIGIFSNYDQRNNAGNTCITITLYQERDVAMFLRFAEIKEIVGEILSSINEYEGGFWRLAVMGFCVLVIAVINRKDIAKVCAPVILNTVLLLTPHLYKYVYADNSYKRFLWLLPEAILVAYTVILVMSRIKKNALKIAFSILMVVLLVVTGTAIYSEEAGMYSKADNLLQVDQSTLDLSEAIMNLDSEPTCIIPYQAMEMIRVADPSIIQTAGRNYYGFIGGADSVSVSLVDCVSSLEPDSDYLFSIADSRRIKIVVTMNYTEIDETICSSYGYEYSGDVGDYRLYYNPNPGPDGEEWYVTQYGPNWGQNYFYSIEDVNNNLIIIDGGHYGNMRHLERVIRDHNYHISAWIITTLNDHHIGAVYDFIRTYGNLVTIDNIYIQDYSEDVMSTVNSHIDEWESSRITIADDFISLINGMDNVVYVSAGDDYDVMGLDLHIYHTWDSAVEEYGARDISNSSLVFSVSGEEDSMLFTSYTTRAIQNDVFEAIGDDQFDYISVNDHGEWVYDFGWYDSRNPVGLFIDDDAAQLQPGGRACEFYSYARQMGYNIYTFETVPNRIIIR